MKKTEETFKEEVEYTTTTFLCETPGCVFTTDDEETAAKHEQAHLIDNLPTTSINGIKFHYFTSEAQMVAWKASFEDSHHDYVEHYNFEKYGKGWYGAEYGDRPCGRGCCTKYGLTLRPLFAIKDEWQEEFDKFKAALEKTEELENAKKDG